MKTKKAISLLLIICLSVLIFAGCSKPEPPAGGESPSIGVSWSLKLATTDLDGNTVDSSAFFENTLTVFNVWATWCPPCVAEIPELQIISEIFAEQGVQIVGVLQDGISEEGVIDSKTVEAAKLLLSEAGVSYLNILPDSTITEEFISKMQFFPTTFFVDSHGRVIQVEVGAKSARDWEAIINGVLETL